MNTIDLFERLDERITASTDELNVAVRRVIDCAATLTAHYYPETGGRHLTVIGSVAKATSTSPMADADAVYHMPLGTYDRFDAYAHNGQSALLQEVRGVLARRFPRTTVRGDGPVVVVQFTSGPNAEIVPAVLVSDPADLVHVSCWVPVTRDGGSWEPADYGAEYERMTRLDADTGGQSSRLIRYMKAWRSNQTVDFKSVLIELMVADFMKTWPIDRSSHVFDDWLTRDFLAYAVNHQEATYTLPSGKCISAGEDWPVMAYFSHQDAASACKHSDGSPMYVAYWRRVFGDDFGI